MSDVPAPWSITITPVVGTEDCIVKTSEGGEWTVKGLAVFADGGAGNLFFFHWNSPDVAAAGFVRSMASAMNGGNPFAERFYRCVLRNLVSATGSGEKKYVTADDLLRRWEAEDVYKAVQEDGKKFN
jgi:hypothetical protein